MKISSYAAAIALAMPLAAFAPVFAQQAPVDPRPANNPEQKPAMAGQTDAPEKKSTMTGAKMMDEGVPVHPGGKPAALLIGYRKGNP